MLEIELSDSTLDTLLAVGLNVVAALAILLVGRWLARRAVDLGGRVMTRRGFDPTVGGFVTNIAYLALLVLVVIAGADPASACRPPRSSRSSARPVSPSVSPCRARCRTSPPASSS